ncbi:hypothetical protein G5714_009592 [Onychostoma macrolepis]|uniref:Uncharacterized protein n=1 Tax=Onychostoma macrolepis TaxID=369639 RepID=A0A7J6CSW3_9TELE|nr:hypothetical protein G5714_009592 [Onychostoma macrolepis]
METQDVLRLLLSHWTKTLKFERRIPLSSQAGGSERGRTCCCFKVGDLVSVIASSLTGESTQTQNGGVSVSVSLDVPETQNGG